MICLHNTPATYVKIPTYAAPTKDIDGTFYFFICIFIKFVAAIYCNQSSDDVILNIYNIVFLQSTNSFSR